MSRSRAVPGPVRGVQRRCSAPARWLAVLVALVSVQLVAAGEVSASNVELVTAAKLVKAPAMAEPGYLREAIDPAFGTRFTQVTRPGSLLKPGMTCRQDYCRHRYSSAQAWNADQSLLLIVNGCGNLCFLDGQTYEPLFARREPGPCEWHPIDPDSMICIFQDAIVAWQPRSNAFDVIWKSPDYSALNFGSGKGNLSRDGRYIAVSAKDASGKIVAFGFDLDARVKKPDIDVSALPGGREGAIISPTGKYIMVSKDAGEVQSRYVFDIDGRLIQRWPEHHRPGHGDMTIDDNGDEVYVGISKSDPDKYHVIKRRLRDGLVTDLLPYGDVEHVSARNINLPGWVFVTYGGTYEEVADNPQWAPFFQEVIAVRIDGSGEIRRVAKTRSVDSGYASQPQASPSPDGTQVIWASNWGKPEGPVLDYVTRLTWPASKSSAND